ncbi:MAG TPA: helix-turn-helix domain-containing protein [Pirellulales bacterium]|nr:helix-turn-helix domain-containing protein [Pirellulales bacterium]
MFCSRLGLFSLICHVLRRRIELNLVFVPDREFLYMPDMLSSTVGAFVRGRRKAGGLSQRELGELARVGTRFVSELERGKPTLRLVLVDQVLAVFGKTLGIVDAPKSEDTER